jgi:hypothetical protein
MAALTQTRQRTGQKTPDRKRRPSPKRTRRARPSSLPETPDWIRRVLTLYTLPGRNEEKWRQLSAAVAKLPISKIEFGDLASRVWDDGYCRLAVRMNAKDGVAPREAKQRVLVLSLAVDVRDIADRLERIVRAKPEENDFATKSLLRSALTEEVIDETAENGPTPIGARFRFPGLIPGLRSLSDAIEASLKSRITPEKQRETQAQLIAVFKRDAFLGGERGASIVELLTDSKGHVHWSVWRMLLELLHPTLTGKLDSRDLKRYAQRMRAPEGGNPQQ